MLYSPVPAIKKTQNGNNAPVPSKRRGEDGEDGQNWNDGRATVKPRTDEGNDDDDVIWEKTVVKAKRDEGDDDVIWEKTVFKRKTDTGYDEEVIWKKVVPEPPNDVIDTELDAFWREVSLEITDDPAFQSEALAYDPGDLLSLLKEESPGSEADDAKDPSDASFSNSSSSDEAVFSERLYSVQLTRPPGETLAQQSSILFQHSRNPFGRRGAVYSPTPQRNEQYSFLEPKWRGNPPRGLSENAFCWQYWETRDVVMTEIHETFGERDMLYEDHARYHAAMIDGTIRDRTLEALIKQGKIGDEKRRFRDTSP